MKEKIAKYVFIIAITALCLYLIVKGEYGNYVLKTKPYKVICAEIVSAIPYRSEIRTRITYEYNDVVYKSTGTFDYVGITKEKYDSFLLGNKKVRIIISESDPTIYMVLNSMDDYYEYNIKASDTVGLHCNL